MLREAGYQEPFAFHCQLKKLRHRLWDAASPGGSLHPLPSVVPSAIEGLSRSHFWGEKRHETVPMCFSAAVWCTFERSGVLK